MAHDPRQFIASLSAKLASRSRHVCLFLGAGVSKACGLPDVADLQKRVLENLNAEQKKQFTFQLSKGHLEQALSRLRRIRALVDGSDTVDSLTGEAATALDVAVCKIIVDQLGANALDDKPMRYLAAWLQRANYHLPAEIFTVNYDLLLEQALESTKTPYFDGFVGNIRGRFQTEMVEAAPGHHDWLPAFFVRLWKLHGSINWQWEAHDVVRLGIPVPLGVAAAIYPSDTKYDESRRVPFVVLLDRFRRALLTQESLLIISGYKFGDAHLNEIIYDAAARRERSEVIAFCRSEIPESLSQRAESTPNIQVVTGTEAIIGGERQDWKIPESEISGIWEDGKFALREFGPLAKYLARSAVSNFADDTDITLLTAAKDSPTTE